MLPEANRLNTSHLVPFAERWAGGVQSDRTTHSQSLTSIELAVVSGAVPAYRCDATENVLDSRQRIRQDRNHLPLLPPRPVGSPPRRRHNPPHPGSFMVVRRFGSTFVWLLFLSCGATRAEEPLHVRIDVLIAAGQAGLERHTAAPASDAEFIRRRVA